MQTWVCHAAKNTSWTPGSLHTKVQFLAYLLSPSIIWTCCHYSLIWDNPSDTTIAAFSCYCVFPCCSVILVCPSRSVPSGGHFFYVWWHLHILLDSTQVAPSVGSPLWTGSSTSSPSTSSAKSPKVSNIFIQLLPRTSHCARCQGKQQWMQQTLLCLYGVLRPKLTLFSSLLYLVTFAKRLQIPCK